MKPPKKLPTIAAEQIEALARQVWGADFVRMEIKPRSGRSERVTFYVTSDKGRAAGVEWEAKLTVQRNRPGGDPDASRKAALQTLNDAIATARRVAAELVTGQT